MAENYHLTFNSEKEGWDIKKEGGTRPSDHFADYDDALARGKELARNNDASLILHDDSGAITGSLSGEDLSAGGLLQAAADKVKGAAGAVTAPFK